MVRKYQSLDNDDGYIILLRKNDVNLNQSVMKKIIFHHIFSCTVQFLMKMLFIETHVQYFQLLFMVIRVGELNKSIISQLVPCVKLW